MRLLNSFFLLVIAAVVVTACSGPNTEQAATPAPANAPRSNVSLNKEDYPVFPGPDAGADPSVSAEQGGKGFTGEGWETNTTFDLIGDPRAVKGGVFREAMP